MTSDRAGGAPSCTHSLSDHFDGVGACQIHGCSCQDGLSHARASFEAARDTSTPAGRGSSTTAPGAEDPRPAEAGAALVQSYLRERFWSLKRSRIQVNPPAASCRASSIGEECERRLYYERTVAAEERIPHEPTLQAIFDLGNEVERFVLRELEATGVEVLQRGRDHVDRLLQLSGHVDALIRIPAWPEPIPLEIKGLNPYTAGTITSDRDIREHHQVWVRKYYWQLQGYLRFERRPLGAFALMNKTTGVIDFVPSARDDAAIAAIEAKAARIRDAVRSEAPPERSPSRDCERCPFLHVCAPPQENGDGIVIVSDPELESALKRRADLEESAREFRSIDDFVKEQLKARPAERILVGDFIVHGKQVHRRAYSVDAGDHWQFTIAKLKGGSNG